MSQSKEGSIMDRDSARSGSQIACQARKPNGDVCGETKSLKIIDEIQQLYEQRLQSLSGVSGSDGDKLRVAALQSWVHDLGEQNTLLVRTIEELEREMCNRVQLLEGKLQGTSAATRDYMTKAQEGKDELFTWVHAELETLRKKSDDIDANDSATTDMMEHLARKDEQIRLLLVDIEKLRGDCFDVAKVKCSSCDATTMTECDLDEPTRDKQPDVLELSRQLQDTDYRLDFALQEKQQLADELASVHRELHFKSQEVLALTLAINEMDKSAKDKQAALTAEVANKHDQVLTLRRETHQLEECCRQADMQTNFKDGIIKEMRKEIKYSRVKIAELERNIFDTNPATDVADKKKHKERYGRSHSKATVPNVLGSGDSVAPSAMNETGKEIESKEPTSQTTTIIAETIRESKSRIVLERHVQVIEDEEWQGQPDLYDRMEEQPEPRLAPHTADCFCDKDEASLCLPRVGNTLQGLQRAALHFASNEIDKSYAQLEAAFKSQTRFITTSLLVDPADVFHSVDEHRMTRANIDTEINLILSNLAIRQKQNKIIETMIGQLQSSLQSTQNELRVDPHFGDGDCVALSDSKQFSLCNTSRPTYDNQFAREQVATDEMKAEVIRLATDLQRRDETILAQAQTIDDLRRALTSAQCDVSPMNQLGKSVSCSATEKAKRGVSFTAEDEADDYLALRLAETRLKEMATTLSMREELITQQARTIETLRSLLREVEVSLTDSEEVRDKRVEELLRSIQLSSSTDVLKPPTLLRSASIEEFRVKTVEAQAAIEDMMDEMETMFTRLKACENNVTDIDKVIQVLQQNLTGCERAMATLGTEDVQNCEFHIVEAEQEIVKLREYLSQSYCKICKAFEKVVLSKQIGDIEQFQNEAKEYFIAVEGITSQYTCAMQSLVALAKQVMKKEKLTLSVCQCLQQIQVDIPTIQSEIARYFKEKEMTERSRRESDRKLEKLQAELELAQDELRSNVERYHSVEYSSVERNSSERGEVVCPRNECASRNYVYNGKDNGVRQAIEEMKLDLDTLTDELEEQDSVIASKETKINRLQEQLANASLVGQDSGCIPALEATIESQKKKIAELMMEIKTMDVKCACAELSVNELSMDLREAEEEIQNAKDFLPTLGEQQTIVDDYRVKSRKLEAELKQARREIETLHKSLQDLERTVSTPHVSGDEGHTSYDAVSCRCVGQGTADLSTQIANQQVTINNLQEALLSTKHQLEELQGKATFEVSGVNSTGSWTWPKNAQIGKHTVHDV